MEERLARLEEEQQMQLAQLRSIEDELMHSMNETQQMQQAQMRSMEEAQKAQMRSMEEVHQTQLHSLEEQVTRMEASLIKVFRSVMPKVEELLARHTRPISRTSTTLADRTRPSGEAERNSNGHRTPVAHSSAAGEGNTLAASDETMSSSTEGGLAEASGSSSTSNLSVSNPTDSPFPEPTSTVPKAPLPPTTSEHPIFEEASVSDQSAYPNSAAWDPPTTLHEAAASGNLMAVQRLLAAGLRVDNRDKRGNTALHLAATNGHVEVVGFLLAKGAGVGKCEYRVRTALHCAAAEGHLAVTRKLVAAGAELERQDSGGCSAIVLAAQGGHGEVVRFLLRSGASVQAADKDEKPHSLFANEVKQEEKLAVSLVGNCAAVDLMDKEGETPLLHAVKAERWDVVRALVTEGAQVNLAGKSGDTPLMLAIRKMNFDVVKLFLESDSYMELEGNAPLFCAIENGYLPIVELLLKHTQNIDTYNKYGESTLFAAVEAEHWDVVYLLMLKGASPLKKNIFIFGPTSKRETYPWDVKSAISLVSYKGNSDLLEDMLKYATNIEREELVRCLYVAGSPDVVWTLLGNTRDLLSGSTCNCALRCAAESGRLEVVEAFLQVGADPLFTGTGFANIKNIVEHTAERGHASCLQVLLQAVSDPSLRASAAEGALRKAAAGGHETLMKELLDDGVDVNAVDEIGCSALQSAAQSGKANCVRLLLERGADRDLQDKWGNTALHLASRSNPGSATPSSPHECVRHLCAAGASLLLKNKRGKTPYDIASNRDLQKLLYNPNLHHF